MLFAAIILGLMAIAVTQPTAHWNLITSGMELRSLIAKTPSPVSDSQIALKWIDPTAWQL